MADQKPGILNPWASVEQPEVEDVREKFENPDLAPHDAVRFSGQSYVVSVGVLRTSAQLPSPELAEALLGGFLRSLFQQFQHSRTIFLAQRISSAPIPESSVTIPLGDFTLYAAAGSRDPVMAHKMALDRIATALTEVKVRCPGARAFFQKYKIDVRMRVR